MNDEEFEKNLQTLTSALERPDPTAAWKADILARASRETATPLSRRLLPPRWLLFSWVAAWVAIAWMSFTTPRNADPGRPTNFAITPDKPNAKPISEMNASPQTLIAFQRHFNFDNP